MKICAKIIENLKESRLKFFQMMSPFGYNEPRQQHTHLLTKLWLMI